MNHTILQFHQTCKFRWRVDTDVCTFKIFFVSCNDAVDLLFNCTFVLKTVFKISEIITIKGRNQLWCING